MNLILKKMGELCSSERVLARYKKLAEVDPVRFDKACIKV